jgi:pimeloyl-ACP methyl ester carboxylesterase
MPELYRMKNAASFCKNAEEIMTQIGSRQVERVSFAYKNSRVGCLKFGEGERLLIAFHGFGDRANLFLRLQDALEKNYTVYAVDLPHHGHTTWREPSFNEKDMKRIVAKILQREDQYHFDLMGYSFGARIVQRLLWSYANQLERIFFIAPDGFNTKWMFEISMIPRPVRYFLWWVLNKPFWFFKILTVFKKYRLINQFIYDFTQKHLGKLERRTRLFSYWLSMDDFVIPRHKVEKKLRQLQIPIDIFLGKQDSIIPVELGNQLAGQIPNLQLHILDADHKSVVPMLNDWLKYIL